jgi:GTP-binding protein
VVRWLHLRGKEKGGPAGGDGGRGGNVVFRAVRDLGVLARYKGRGEFKAESGKAGGNSNMHGADGAHVVIEVPIGSFVTQLETNVQFELLNDNEEVIALSGGEGGVGNAHFKSSTNQNPYESLPGRAGQSGTFTIELKIIADAGIIGLPNAGKSSLLNELTAARAKIGDYPFTTLEPNLGVLFGYVLADIPGLIEGAAEGRGLGHKFLKHIERTKVLIHCLSAESLDPLSDYEVVRRELGSYGTTLTSKPELILVTKTDLISESRVTEITSLFKSKGLSAVPVTILSDESIKNISDTVVQFIEKSV